MCFLASALTTSAKEQPVLPLSRGAQGSTLPVLPSEQAQPLSYQRSSVSFPQSPLHPEAMEAVLACGP